MLDREFLDAHLPLEVALPLARKLTGLAFYPDREYRWLARGLQWIQDFVENDRHWWAKEPGRNPEPSFEFKWEINCSGLEYKSSGHYLTSEGWCLGTTCWFGRVEMGWRENVGATTPTLAMLRTMIVMCLAKESRKLPEAERPNMVDLIIQARREWWEQVKQEEACTRGS